MTGSIPVIDLATYLARERGSLDRVARQIHDALTQVGFLVITGHHVPDTLIA